MKTAILSLVLLALLTCFAAARPEMKETASRSKNSGEDFQRGKQIGEVEDTESIPAGEGATIYKWDSKRCKGWCKKIIYYSLKSS